MLWVLLLVQTARLHGDGGAIFTNDEELARKMKSIRIHGAGKDKYENIRIGINGRLDTLQAAVLLEKIEIFDNELSIRNNIADYYTQNINENSYTNVYQINIFHLGLNIPY